LSLFLAANEWERTIVKKGVCLYIRDNPRKHCDKRYRYEGFLIASHKTIFHYKIRRDAALNSTFRFTTSENH
jgi:hypothetical protein